jgi:hypothetical protein
MRNGASIMVGKHEGRDRSEDLDVDGRIILNWVFFLWSRSRSVSIVSGYGLDDQAIEVRSPTRDRGFFF